MNLQSRIEGILRSKPSTRSSDKELLLEVWQSEGFEINDTQKRAFMDRATTAESITRARRKLRWKYPGDKKIEQERRRKEQDFKERYNPDKAIAWAND